MEILFDKMANTPSVHRSIKKEFDSHHYIRDNRYHLVIDGITVAGLDIKHMKFYKMEGNGVMLYCVEVYEPFRRQGYGKLLLHETEKVCMQLDISIIGLNCHVKNTNALKLYQGHGFEIVNQLDGRYINEHAMRKFLLEGVSQEYYKRFEEKNY